jgi:hypothetical protein
MPGAILNDFLNENPMAAHRIVSKT